MRRMFINMAQREWAEAYDWKTLYRENNSRVSTSTGNTSIALPAEFRKSAANPKVTYDGSNTEYFPVIRPQERYQYRATDRFVYFLGDQNSGWTMVVNAGTLASGASVHLPFYRSPASLVSPANIVMCPNPEYLVQRTLAYIWESQSDERFPQAKSEADKILQRLLEYEASFGEGYYDRVKTIERTQFDGFRWGRD